MKILDRLYFPKHSKTPLHSQLCFLPHCLGTVLLHPTISHLLWGGKLSCFYCFLSCRNKVTVYQMYRARGPTLRVPMSVWAHLMCMFIGPRRQWYKYLRYPEGYEHQWLLIRSQIMFVCVSWLACSFVQLSFSVQLFVSAGVDSGLICVYFQMSAFICVHVWRHCVCSVIFKEVMVQMFRYQLLFVIWLTKQPDEITQSSRHYVKYWVFY